MAAKTCVVWTRSRAPAWPRRAYGPLPLIPLSCLDEHPNPCSPAERVAPPADPIGSRLLQITYPAQQRR